MECSKGIWVKNMTKCIGDFRRSGMEIDAVRRLSDCEVGDQDVGKCCLEESYSLST